MAWNEEQKLLIIQFNGVTTTIPTTEIIAHQSNVERIVIQNGFTHVPARCFAGCSSLTSIDFPNSIEIFEDNVMHTTSVREVHIPLHTYKIDSNNPFDNTLNTLERFTIDPNHKYFAVIDDVLYTKDLKLLIAYPPAKNQKTFMIPSTVKSIGCTSFEHSDILQNLLIPPSVTNISSYFCISMNALKSITFFYSDVSEEIGKSRVTINKGSFLQGSSINESDIEWVFLPKVKSVPTYLEKKAFISLTHVYLFVLFPTINNEF